MARNANDLETLTPGAERLVEAALRLNEGLGRSEPGQWHWLLALVERHGEMAERLARGLEAAALQDHLRKQLRAGDHGEPLSRETVLQRAGEHARAEGKQRVAEPDLAAIILASAGYELAAAAPPAPGGVSAARPGTGAGGATPVEQPFSSLAPAMPRAADAAPRAAAGRPTPALEKYGRDLTREAREGRLPPVVGRAEEIALVLETLCRQTKRNPVLVGPAGVGKTAIVEGLAQRIAAGETPAVLRGTRVLAIQPSVLVSGSGIVGELQKRMGAVLREASQEGIVLFIDEVHSIIGAGGAEGSGDIASQLKPALARGELAVIAATTDDEYRRFIERDPALERRFQPVRVQQLSPEKTLAVLCALAENLERRRGVRVTPEVLRWLVRFAEDFLRNRYFPDKAVDLLEQCVAYAVTQGRTQLSREDVEHVTQRLVGMPLALVERLPSLRERLERQALMRGEELQMLLERLEVSLRGLDLRPSRPNAVVLLLGSSTPHADLADAIAETLFGSAERVVTLDFSRFANPHDLSMLLGAPPGYVGYSDSLPLHRVAQMPWCVLCGENVHACHPQVREVLRAALADGVLTDARGKHVYLSDAVVLLTAAVDVETSRALGFIPGGAPAAQNARAAALQVLGKELVEQADLVYLRELHAEDHRHWLESTLLTTLSQRYLKEGIRVLWDESLIVWLLNQRESKTEKAGIERLIEQRVNPLLVRHLAGSSRDDERSVRVGWAGDAVHVEAVPLEKSEL